MSNLPEQRKSAGTITLEMVARLIGAMALLTGLVYLWGLIYPMRQDQDVSWQIALLILGSISLAVAWRWELIGGLAALLCGIVLAALISVSSANSYNPMIRAFVYGSPFFIAGLFFLVDAFQQGREGHYQVNQ